MFNTIVRALYAFTVFATHGGDNLEATDRLAPPGWRGNFWGPAATKARATGELSPIVMTDRMTQWDRWGRSVLRDGDLLFRRADARILFGYHPFSRFLANITGSAYSHVATVAIENGEPVVYDTTKAGVRRQPFAVWTLDIAGAFGVKRLKPPYREKIPGVIAYLHRTFEQQVPFDFNLSPEDDELYCVEMAEKAFRSQGLVLSEPVKIRDMERFREFPINVLVLRVISKVANGKPLQLDTPVYCPGNARHGIWSSPYLEAVYPPPAATTSGARAASAQPRSS